MSTDHLSKALMLETGCLLLTIFQCKRTDHVPADSSDINPPHLDPRLFLTRLLVLKEPHELPVGHPPKARAQGRIVDDVNQTLLSDVPIVQVCALPARIDTGLRANVSTQHHGRRAVHLDHFAHRRAKAIARRAMARMGTGGSMVAFGTFDRLGTFDGSNRGGLGTNGRVRLGIGWNGQNEVWWLLIDAGRHGRRYYIHFVLTLALELVLEVGSEGAAVRIAEAVLSRHAGVSCKWIEKREKRDVGCGKSEIRSEGGEERCCDVLIFSIYSKYGDQMNSAAQPLNTRQSRSDPPPVVILQAHTLARRACCSLYLGKR